MSDINKTGNKIELFLKLLQKVKEINESNENQGMAEDEIYLVFKEIEELKKKLPKIEINDIDYKIRKILGEEYDSFIETLNENDE